MKLKELLKLIDNRLQYCICISEADYYVRASYREIYPYLNRNVKRICDDSDNEFHFCIYI